VGKPDDRARELLRELIPPEVIERVLQAIAQKERDAEPCSHSGCQERVLPLSQPPACETHVQNVADWRERVFSELSPRATRADGTPTWDMPDPRLVFIGEVTRVGGELFKAHKFRVDPRPSVEFCFGDIVYFALGAAVTGILGNLPYDVLKSLVLTWATKHRRPDQAGMFEQVVIEEEYERLRAMRNRDGSSAVEVVRVRRKRSVVRVAKSARKKPRS
jgi:hypothetical protein